jgi:hypothetical protein
MLRSEALRITLFERDPELGVLILDKNQSLRGLIVLHVALCSGRGTVR